MSLPPRLLVVGGSGFIGRHIVNRAAGLGWRVSTLGLAPRSAIEVPGAFRSIAADLSDRGALAEQLGDGAFEYVVNCGGYIDHRGYFSGGREVMNAHFLGVLNLAETLPRDALRAFVNLGSSDEYGNGPAPQKESQKELPATPYALGKVAATHFLQMLSRADGFPAVILRIFLCYGPGQFGKYLVPQIIRGCLDDEAFAVSAGEQLRDFCYIDDIVDAVFAAFASPAARGEVINLGSGEPMAVRKLIETVTGLVGGGNPRFGQRPYRTGENMALYPDISKALSCLSWRPRVDLDSGLRRTIQAMREVE